ncbi:hypothetical protein ACU686_30020 [Yinghuangia aomiensis]
MPFPSASTPPAPAALLSAAAPARDTNPGLERRIKRRVEVLGEPRRTTGHRPDLGLRIRRSRRILGGPGRPWRPPEASGSLRGAAAALLGRRAEDVHQERRRRDSPTRPPPKPCLLRCRPPTRRRSAPPRPRTPRR